MDNSPSPKKPEVSSSSQQTQRSISAIRHIRNKQFILFDIEQQFRQLRTLSAKYKIDFKVLIDYGNKTKLKQKTTEELNEILQMTTKTEKLLNEGIEFRFFKEKDTDNLIDIKQKNYNQYIADERER